MAVLATNSNTHAYTQDDLDILAHVICGEAEGCSLDMKESVGSVVLNRVADSRFPSTIAEVVFQEGQYACTWDGNYYREPSDETYRVAEDLLTYGSKIDESVYDIIGNMYFCY